MSTFKVVDYKWPKLQEEHKGHNQNRVIPGTIVYAIKHLGTGTHFYYAYNTLEEAESVFDNLEYSDTSVQLETNFRELPVVVVAKIKGYKGA